MKLFRLVWSYCVREIYFNVGHSETNHDDMNLLWALSSLVLLWFVDSNPFSALLYCLASSDVIVI